MTFCSEKFVCLHLADVFSRRYSVVVITRDFDVNGLPETQVRTLVAPFLPCNLCGIWDYVFTSLMCNVTSRHYSVVVITRDFEKIPETQVRTLVAPLFVHTFRLKVITSTFFRSSSVPSCLENLTV